MAGKKQHHIPQSVQRGFLFDMKGERTYVYRRNGTIFPQAIRDVAAQRFFYSRLSSDGSKTLDDEITDYESRLGTLLNKLRAVPINSAVDADVAAEVIAHLTPRTAHLRRIFGNGMHQLMTVATEVLADEDTMIRLLGLLETEPNDIWNNHISRMLDKDESFKAMLKSLPIPKTLLDRAIFMAAKEHFVSHYNADSLGIMQALTSLLNELDDIVRDGHNKALSQGLIADSRKLSLQSLDWHIRAAPNEGAIFPDCVALGADEEDGKFSPYMMTRTSTVSVVILPITSQKLLVGVRTGHVEPDLANFNSYAAACSADLFISASQTQFFSDLISKMGESWEGEINAAIQGALQEMIPTSNISSKSGEKLPLLSQLSYQLTFSGFGDIDIHPISQKTQHIIEKIKPLFDLDRLDGITFATPFQQAIEELERGFNIDTMAEAAPDYIAQGAATVVVLREGILKVRIILNAEYGLSLIGNNRRDAEVALHLVVAGITQACTVAQVERSIPGFLIKPVAANDHAGGLYCAVCKALRAYRYAQMSAGFGADELIGEEFATYLINAFSYSKTAIEKAKMDHLVQGNYPALYEAALGSAADMLISTARLIGHYHGLGQFEFSSTDSKIREIMSSQQLGAWIEVFARDLQHFWEKNSWAQKDFYGFNIHVERLLWSHGVFIWRDNENGTMVTSVVEGDGTHPKRPSNATFPNSDIPG